MPTLSYVTSPPPRRSHKETAGKKEKGFILSLDVDQIG